MTPLDGVEKTGLCPVFLCLLFLQGGGDMFAEILSSAHCSLLHAYMKPLSASIQRLQFLSGQCRCFIGAGFQLQITDQTDAALGMQGGVDMFDCGKDGGKLSLDIGAGGMCFQRDIVTLKQFNNPADFSSYRDASADRDDL